MGNKPEGIDNSGCEPGVRSTRPKSYAAVEQGDVIHAKPEVDTIQRWLIERGHSEVGGKGGKPDGQFGDKSGQAFHDEIERIQKANGIKPDGRLGPETMEALRQEAPEVAEAVKRLQDDKVGSRPSAMDRIYNAKRYESKPDMDDNSCRAPSAPAAPKHSAADPDFMRRLEEAMERGSTAQGSSIGGAAGGDDGAERRRGTLDTSGLAKLRDLGADSPAMESPVAAITNSISSWASRIKSSFS